MILKIEVVATLLAFTFVQLITAVEYRSEMLSQRISYFENPYFDMDVKFYGDEGYPYLILQNAITPYNDFHLMLYAKNFDQQPVLLSHSPVSLCQLLHDTSVEKNKEYLSSPMAQFNLQQIFNFNGKVCPIEQSTIRLSPYIFPANFTFDESLGCGFKNIEARFMKCAEELSPEGIRDCETLLKNVMGINLDNDNCQNESQNEITEPENSWIFDKIIDTMKML